MHNAVDTQDSSRVVLSTQMTRPVRQRSSKRGLLAVEARRPRRVELGPGRRAGVLPQLRQVSSSTRARHGEPVRRAGRREHPSRSRSRRSRRPTSVASGRSCARRASSAAHAAPALSSRQRMSATVRRSSRPGGRRRGAARGGAVGLGAARRTDRAGGRGAPRARPRRRSRHRGPRPTATLSAIRPARMVVSFTEVAAGVAAW